MDQQTLNPGDSLNGAGGIDTLNVQLKSSVNPAQLTNIEVIKVESTNDNAALNLIGANNVTDVYNNGTADNTDLTFTNITAGANLYVTNVNATVATATNFGYTTAGTSGTTDSANLTLNNATGGTNNNITVNGIETINVITGGSVASSVKLIDNAVTTVTVDAAGTQALTLVNANATLTLVDASNFTKNLTVGLVADGEIDGGSGNDTLSVNAAGFDVSIDGGEGSDTITGNTGDDTLHGNEGDDVIEDAAGGDNIVDGNEGDDVINITGAGDNEISGGDGDDLITATGAGDNVVNGGVGDDFIIMTANFTTADTVDGGTGGNLLSVTADGVSGAGVDFNVENIQVLDLVQVNGTAETVDISRFSAYETIEDIITDADVDTASLTLQNVNEGTEITIFNSTAATTQTLLAVDLDTTTGTNSVNVILETQDATADLTLTTLTATDIETVNLYTAGESAVTVGAVTTGAVTALSVHAETTTKIGTGTGLTITTVDATGSTGDVALTFGAAATTATGGLGDDTFNFGANLSATDHVDGGEGSNTVTFTMGAAGLKSATVTNVESLVVAATNGTGIFSAQNTSGVTDIEFTSANAVNDAQLTNLQASTTDFLVSDDMDNLTLGYAAGVTADATLTIAGNNAVPPTDDIDIADLVLNNGASLTITAGGANTGAPNTQSISGTAATNATSVTFNSAAGAVLDVAGNVTADSAATVTLNAVTANASVDGTNSFDTLDNLVVNAALGADAVFVGTNASAGATVASATGVASGTDALVDVTLNVTATAGAAALTEVDYSSTGTGATVDLTAVVTSAANSAATIGDVTLANASSSDVLAVLTADSDAGNGNAAISSLNLTAASTAAAAQELDVTANLYAGAGTATIGELNVSVVEDAVVELNIDVTTQTTVGVTTGSVTGAGTFNVLTTDVVTLSLANLDVTDFTGVLSVTGDVDLDSLTGTAYGDVLDVSDNITGATVTGGEGSDAITLDAVDDAIDTVAYEGQADSTGTVYDYVTNFVGDDGITATPDLLDLTALGLAGGAYDDTLAAAVVTTDVDGVTTFEISAADALDFFALGVAVASNDDGLGGVDANTVVFVDANLSGNWEADEDMAIVLVGVAQGDLTDAGNFSF